MMRLALLLAATLAFSMPAICQATPSPNAAPVAAHVKVSRCDAQFNYGHGGGPASSYVGYSAGYYPSTPYYWDDPFGLAYYQPPASSPSRLFIDFTNVSSKPMKTVVFGLVIIDILIAEVRDQGMFAPGAEIKRLYGIHPPATPRVKPQCVALKIEYADGTSWMLKPMPTAENGLYVKNH
jgi:hypothetical protein